MIGLDFKTTLQNIRDVYEDKEVTQEKYSDVDFSIPAPGSKWGRDSGVSISGALFAGQECR